MKYISDILTQFSAAQRMFVLFVLLIFSSGTYLVAAYMKDADCQSLRDENISLQQDFVKISILIHKEEMNRLDKPDTTFVDLPTFMATHKSLKPISSTNWDDISAIVQKHQK